MPKRKLKIKKAMPAGRHGFFRPVHLQAALVLIAYYFISNFIFVSSLAHANILVSFFVPLSFGTLSCFVFLYLFGHKDFFHFVASLERTEKKNEKKYLDKFGHFGKIFACILISAVAGPILLALTVRFLFSRYQNRYLIAFISVLVPTLIAVAVAKGILGLIF
jgi:hypothetical protein